MHRPFKYISSPIQRLHEHVEEIVGIWCDAAGAFSVDLIQDATLRDLTENILLRGKKEGGKMVGQKKWSEIIEEIFYLFRDKLTTAERETIRQGFMQNNRIEDLCNNTADPVHYSDLPKAIRQPLKDFFTELYEDVLERKPFIDAYESTISYFKHLMKASDSEVCPFCALNDLKSRYHDRRDAFDHFLPKGKYPFNSINFKNLAPICHECNSEEKLTTDPLFGAANKTKRRRAFFPFADAVAEVGVSAQFKVDLTSISIASLEPNQFEISLTCSDVEAAATWDAVFDMRKRYVSKICQWMKRWLNQLLDEYKEEWKDEITFEKFLDKRISTFKRDSLADKNFLRYAIFSRLREDGILVASMQEMLNN